MGNDYVSYIIWRSDTNTPFYVGSGKRGRLRSFPSNRRANEILEEIRKKGCDYYRTHMEHKTRAEAVERETFLINSYGREIDGGILTNLRIGDRGGVQGRKLSVEDKLKMSKRRKGVSFHTEEHKKNLSKRMKGNQYRKGHKLNEEERKLRSIQTKEGIRKARERKAYGNRAG